MRTLKTMPCPSLPPSRPGLSTAKADSWQLTLLKITFSFLLIFHFSGAVHAFGIFVDKTPAMIEIMKMNEEESKKGDETKNDTSEKDPLTENATINLSFTGSAIFLGSIHNCDNKAVHQFHGDQPTPPPNYLELS